MSLAALSDSLAVLVLCLKAQEEASYVAAEREYAPLIGALAKQEADAFNPKTGLRMSEEKAMRAAWYAGCDLHDDAGNLVRVQADDFTPDQCDAFAKRAVKPVYTVEDVLELDRVLLDANGAQAKND